MSSQPEATIRILIVDDHVIVRGGLRMLLESQAGFTVVGEAGSKSEALDVFARESPNIVILDLDLGGESGLDLLPELVSAGSGARVIVLTGVRDQDVHRRCVELGADGLLLKDKASEILIKAVRKVHAGEDWLERSMMRGALDQLRNQGSKAQADPEAEKIRTLTEREREVIALVGLGLKNKQVAERLFISDTTVRHHLTSIFSKLGVSDRLELVIYAYRHKLAKPPG